MAGTGLAAASSGNQMRAASLTPSASGMNTFSISLTFFGKLSIARIVVLLLLKTANLEFLAGTIQERKSKVGRQVFAVPILGSSGLARKSQWFATRRAGTARGNRGAFLGLRQASVMTTGANAPRDPDTSGDIDTP